MQMCACVPSEGQTAGEIETVLNASSGAPCKEASRCELHPLKLLAQKSFQDLELLKDI